MNVNGNGATEKAVANKEKSEGMNLKQWIYKMADQIKCALPQNITPERMMRIAMTAISKDTKLASCTPNSFLGALLTSAQLGLECNTPLGQAYLIPFYNGKAKCLETQFQLGYQGLLDLCYRTGQYRTIQARIVYEGDEFHYQYGLNEDLSHIPMGKSEKPVYVYAYYQLVNGAKAFEVMSWDAIMSHKMKYSQAAKSGYFSPWDSDPESMAKKTVLKKVLKYAPKTVEVAEGISGDSAVINTNIVKDGTDVSVIKNFDYSFDKNMAVDVESTETKEITKTEKKSKKTEKTPAENPAEVTPDEEKAIDEAFEEQASLAFEGKVGE